jgi:tRNA-dihydrouridine synthase B
MYIKCMKTLQGFPLDVNFPLCMAPMVGLSHIALRAVAKSYLPEGAKTIWPSEMLNSRRIPSEILKDIPEAMKSDDEDFWVPQILGNDEKFIALSVAKLQAHGALGIDINMGCPATKALKHNYGVALMGDFDYAARVVDMTVRNTSLPVSVKLRAGFQKDTDKIVEFVSGLEKAGASWITLHPRTAEQKRRGSADWSQILKIKQASSIPIIGNGDVETYEDALEMMRQTQCDMVMVGRAMTARPWILWQLGHALGWAPPKGKEGLPPMTAEEEGREFYFCALEVLHQMRKHFKPVLTIKKYQFYIRTAAVWLEYGHALFSDVTKGKTPEDIEQTLHRFFSTEQRMMKKTILRS